MINVDEIEELFRGLKGVHLSLAHPELPAIRVERDGCIGEIYLQGGHVTCWIPPRSTDVLFVSRKSLWTPGKAIRGGVPICFPWFGPKTGDSKAPQHGFARTRTWKLSKVEDTQAGIVVEMSFKSDAETRQLWPYDFVIVHRVTFGASLNMELEVTNSGSDAFTFEEAQHAYFRVGNAADASLHGLENCEYLDKTQDYARKRQSGAIEIRKETDRVYESSGEVVIEDESLKRNIVVKKLNSRSTVVWNPWIDRARALADFGDDEWKEMVCVETSNVRDQAVHLKPGESHRMQTEINVRSRS